MSHNLPPGVNVNDLPGNRPEDHVWDETIEDIIDEACDENLSSEEFYAAWRIGLKTFLQLRDLRATFPFDVDPSDQSWRK